jgi:hypothetical protein
MTKQHNFFLPEIEMAIVLTPLVAIVDQDPLDEVHGSSKCAN